MIKYGTLIRGILLLLLLTLPFDRISITPQGSFVNVYAYQILMVVFIAACSIIYRKLYFKASVLVLFFLVIVHSALVISTANPEVKELIKFDVKLFMLLMFFVVAENFILHDLPGTIKTIRWSLLLWLLSSLFFLCLYIYSGTNFGIYIDRYFPIPRMTGLNNDPNVFGIYLLTFLPLSLYFQQAKASSPRFANIKIMALIALSVLCILLTFSRSNLPIMVIFLLVYSLYAFLWEKNFKLISIMAVATIGATCLIYLFVPQLLQAIELRVEQLHTEANLNSDSRFGLWIKGLSIFIDNPFLGIGLGQSINHMGKYIHNTFLEWIVSCGILGITIIGLYCAYLVRHLRNLFADRLNDYILMAYLCHFMAIGFVSLPVFEPTFFLFALSEAYFIFRRRGQLATIAG